MVYCGYTIIIYDYPTILPYEPISSHEYPNISQYYQVYFKTNMKYG